MPSIGTTSKLPYARRAHYADVQGTCRFCGGNVWLLKPSNKSAPYCGVCNAPYTPPSPARELP